MAFTEDFSVFFNTDEFATTGTYDGTTAVDGILDVDYAAIFQGEQAGVSSTRPVFIYPDADLSPEVGKEIEVDSVVYTVRDIETDNGIGRLILESTGTVIPPPSATGVFSTDFSADFD